MLKFDLDNSLLDIPKPSEYFDNILLETIKKLSAAPIPNRQERNKFWYSENEYINLLKKWGIGDPTSFWMHFDEIDFEWRKNLLKKDEIYLFEDVITVLKELYNSKKKTAIISNTADYIIEYFVNRLKINQFFDSLFINCLTTRSSSEW